MDALTHADGGERKSGGFRYAVLLFFLAPLVGEFLLGNLPITLLPALIVLAPLYGGGAVLIRETIRRLGWGWPSMIPLGVAYGVVEEAFVTQSLFNPNYLGLRLLDFGFIPALGISSWWTLFVLTIHTVWSTAVPIALAEAASRTRSRTPWLGKTGLGGMIVVFLAGCVATARLSDDPFRATNMQFAASGATIVALVAVAVVFGMKGRNRAVTAAVPAPWILGVGSLALGSAFWAAVYAPVVAVSVGGMLALLAVGGATLLRLGNRLEWKPNHEFAVACGLLMTYAWFGFVQHPTVGAVSPAIDMMGNALFASGAIALSWIVYRRLVRANKNSEHAEPQE